MANNTRRILRLLDRHDVKATFFVLGWVAEREPNLVREIHAAGHEIGSHSYWHRLVYKISPEEFRSDLRRSCDVLESITGQAVTAYRAPSFSITRKSLWALDVLAEEGITVDSSVFPIYHHRCGIPGAPRHPYVHETTSGSLWEFPASVARVGKANLPISGGGYFRLLPYGLTRRLLHRVNVQLGEPFVFYIHPWDLDADQPRLQVSTQAMRFRHYVNLKSTERRFDRLLSQFQFARLDTVTQRYFDS